MKMDSSFRNEQEKSSFSSCTFQQNTSRAVKWIVSEKLCFIQSQEDLIWLKPPTLAGCLIPCNVLKVISKLTIRVLFRHHKTITERPARLLSVEKNSFVCNLELLLCTNLTHKRAAAYVLSWESTQGNVNECNEFGLICCVVKWGIIYGW